MIISVIIQLQSQDFVDFPRLGESVLAV